MVQFTKSKDKNAPRTINDLRGRVLHPAPVLKPTPMDKAHGKPGKKGTK